jgi:TATA-box binding protein (TBP) (component of TFIID and TFIIIB)
LSYEPISKERSEEFEKFKILVNFSTANCLFEPHPLHEFMKAFPKGRLFSEWERDHPLSFARSRFVKGSIGFMSPSDGLRIQDGEFLVSILSDGKLIAHGPRPVANVLNLVADYARTLRSHGLYSGDLFAAHFFEIGGTARIPLREIGGIDLLRAVGFLVHASYNPAESPSLVYNMKAMDAQIWLQASGEVQFATNIEESNIIRSLKLLQESLEEGRDVSVDTIAGRERRQEGRSEFVFCVGCGKRIPIDASFCASCGKEQPKL